MSTIQALVAARIAPAALALSSMLCTQTPVWTELPRSDGDAPTVAQSAYDHSRQRLVSITANAVIECDRAAFRTVGPGVNLLYSAVAYDEARKETVAFGGSGFFFVDATTRTWNGSTWTITNPTTSPPGRQRAAMAFDRQRDRIVLFGGRDVLNTLLGDTWEYDGSTWTQVASGGPAPRSNHAMTFDPVRGVVVLFGGLDSAYLGDTWEWNGSNWSQSSAGPAAIASALAYDEARQRCVLVSYVPVPPTTSTWERIGTNWTLREAVSPLAFAQVGGAFDAVLGRVVVAAPDRTLAGANPLWAWSGSTWTPVTTGASPPYVDGAAVAPCAVTRSTLRFGANQTLFSGHDATFEWRGGEWRRVPTSNSPPALTDVALAAEPGGTTLLFGGRDAAGAVRGETWRYLGGDWQLVNPGNAPSPRSQHGMAFDSLRGRIVLFGGVAGTTLLGDTWEWDGSAWTQRFPAQSPPTRANPAMTFDAANGVTLLFGGGERTGPARSDFWRWDGTNWQAIVTASGPTARARAQFAWDPLRQRAVLAGGFAQQVLGLGPVIGTYEWDGAQWTQLGGTQPPPSLLSLGGFDEATGRYVLHSGSLLSPGSVWQFGTPSVAAVSTFGTPCAGSSGQPQLVAPTLPKTGNPHFALRLGSLLPGAPALLGVGPAPTSVPLGSGCTLLVALPQIIATLADAAGVARFALPLPASPALHGATFASQGAGIDAQGPFANLAAFSAGLAITID